MEIFNGKFTRTAPRVFRGDLVNLPSGAASFFDLFGTPAAGYSLRDLSGTNPNLIRVRRSSNDAERDFKPTEINNGTLLNWVNEDVILYASDFSGGVSPFLIDTGGSSAAPITKAGESDTLEFTCDASTGQHFTNMTGPFNADGSNVSVSFDYYIPSSNAVVNAIRLWNGFGADGTIEGTVLNAWTSASGTIVNNNGSNLRIQATSGGSSSFGGASGDKIYIKNIVVTQTTANGLTSSYNSLVDAKNATQVTASEQPRIVNAGTLETIGSDAAINFTSSLTKLVNNSTFAGINSSSVVSLDIDFETGADVSTRQNFLAFNDSGNVLGCGVFAGRLYVEGFNGTPVTGGYIPISANTRYKFTIVWNGTTLSAVYLNGASQTITVSTIGLMNSTGQGLQIGSNAGGSFPFFGKIITILAYSEAKDAAHNLGFTNAY